MVRKSYTMPPSDKMKYLDLTLPSPAENIACDEQLLDDAERGDGGEVLRVWESPQPFVVVGYGNTIATEVDVAACAARGIPVLRRCSGGGTVVQGQGCLSYALILNIAANPELRNVTAANRFIMERNRRTIAECGVRSAESIAVQGHTDLTLDGLKFSGNAQRRRRQFILFHGTFLLNFDLALISELLPLPSRQPCYREARPHEKFLTNLDLPAVAVKAALRRAWRIE
ncbi:MAG: lipoate--protein ligase family protein [Verrucomicrobia bacterium]|nr:lipoate--protein ligase family protein [Verrucomicrobiota bacterium]